MIIELSVAVIAFFIVVFVIGLLILSVQLRRTAREAEKLMDTARQHITPLAHDVTLIANDVKKIVQSVQQQVAKVETGVDALKETAIRIGDFEKALEEKIQHPLLELSFLITAVSKAVRSVKRIWKK